MSPADGGLSYDPSTLTAKAGELTIDYTNPSRVDHDVTLEREGEEVGKSDLIANDTASLAALVEAGEYTYFCSVPGHREGGMEGTLTVK
jgi:plastocyanin